jgi:hypothetical protein
MLFYSLRFGRKQNTVLNLLDFIFNFFEIFFLIAVEDRV